MSILAAFPADWRCDLTIERGGGLNADGDPQGSSSHTLTGCLVGARSTRDPVDRSDVTESTAMAYAAPRADVRSTDTVIVPEAHHMAGKYVVDGEPSWWPLGTEIPLRRA